MHRGHPHTPTGKSSSRPGYTKETSKSAAQKAFGKKYEATRGGPRDEAEAEATTRELEGLIRRDITPTKYDKPTGFHPGVGRDKSGNIIWTSKNGEKKVVTDDGGKKVVTDEKEQYDAIEDFWNEDLGTWDIRKARQNIGLLQRLTGRKIANITADGTIIFADQMGGTMKFMQVMDKLSSGLDKLVGFDPNKALTEGGMGDQGKAALYHKLSGMSPSELRDFLNRKGNLERIMEFAGQGAAGGPSPDFDITKLKAAASEGGMGGQFLADIIASTGGEDFRMMKLKNSPNKADRQKYYELNPPRTSADAEEAAMAGISWIEGYGTVERPEGQGGGIGGLGGGGGGGLPPTTDPTTTTVPDYVLKQQYMPGFTPDYSGGAEQMHIAGGYWDPVTKKWIGGGGPWGTQSQYQFNQGGIVGTSPLLFKNQGGMVNDGGIKSFKKYGY